MVHVGRFRRVQGHGRLDAGGAGRWCLAWADVFQADVGRHVDQGADIADGVGAEEELFIGTRQTVVHRPYAQAVGHHFGAHAAGAIVDHERIAGWLQHMAHDRVGPVTGEGLRAGDFVGKLRSEVTEGFQAVGQRRVALAQALQRVGGAREAAVRVGAHDHGIGFAVENLVAVDHVDDRLAGLAFGDPRFDLRVACLVVDHRLAGGGAARCGQAHFFFGEGVAVAATVFGQYHDLTEQTVGDVARRAFAAKGGGFAGGGKGPFALGVQGVAAGTAGRHQEVATAAGVGGNVGDAVHRLQAVDLEAYQALGDLLVGDEAFTAFVLDFVFRPFFLFTLDLVFVVVDPVLVGVGLISQQVGEVDGQALAGGHAQHDRPWAFVRAQGDLARHGGTALAERYLLVVHHILAEGEHHAVGVLRTKTVEHHWLVQCHHVGHQGTLALHSRLAGRLPTEYGKHE
ncbi:hypothetical protein D3C81_475880 [compost metagenome]